MEQQEQFMKINMLGQEAERLEQQIQLIDRQISEINSVKESLLAINTNSKEKNREILANLGKGIFIKAKLDENNNEKSKELFVNIGNGVIVKKTPEETIKIIEDQEKKMLLGKEEFMNRIYEIQSEMQNVLEDVRKNHENQEKASKN
jgi:prefoldin alpha subunit